MSADNAPSRRHRSTAVPRLLLGHGASGNAASMRPHVEGLSRRGIEAVALDLPRGSAERAMPRFLDAAGDALADTAVGGHSYGGRVASMVAADHEVAALVLLSYPLHRPGHPEQLRTDHWPRLRCPVLVLSGESDPFAKVDLLRTWVGTLANAELATYPHVGHGLTPVLDDALDRIAGFLRSVSR
jgi:uncharacterized protein